MQSSKLPECKEFDSSFLLASLLHYHLPNRRRLEITMHRVLIIEDDEEMAALLKDFLTDEGVGADSAGSGSEAFRKLARGSFDLVITDIRMPGLTGLDILPGIKKLQPEAPIIVMTAFGGEEVRRKCFNRGATAYLEKPIHLHILKGLIQEMVSGKDRRVRA